MEVFNDGTYKYINYNHYTSLIHLLFQKRTTVRVTRANTTQRVQVSTKISFVTVRRAFKARTAAKVNNMLVFVVCSAATCTLYMYTFMYVHVVLLRGCNILSFRFDWQPSSSENAYTRDKQPFKTEILSCFFDIHVHVYLN